MKRFGLFIIKSFALIIYLFSYLFPRKKNRWLFGEAHGFNNNSKYLYLEVLEEHPDIEPIWIGDKQTVSMLKEKNLPACCRYSLKGIFLCLCSKVYVVSWTTSDISFYFSGGAYVVNLWHGLAWKKCQWLKDTEYDNSSMLKKIEHFIISPSAHFPPRIVLSTSSFYTDVYAKTFRVEKECCVEDIYPRVKFMLKPKDDIIKHLTRYSFDNYIALIDSLYHYNRVFLYAPTFRDTGDDFIRNSGLDFYELNKQLKDYKYYMLVKFHPATKYDASKISNLSNIRILDISYDLNLIMPFSDILITDYSTTLVDYMLLNKRIIAFTFDYDYYISQCRELLFPFDECIKGIPRVNDAAELMKLMFSDYSSIPCISKELLIRYWEPSCNLFNEIYRLSH